MNDDGDLVIDPRAARDALARSGQAGADGRRAARRAIRRDFLALGVAFTGCLLANGAVHRWVDGTAFRALINAAFVALLVALATQTMARTPVRARLARGRLVAVLAGGVLVFAIPMGLSWDFALAYPLGAAAIMAYWSGAAWWLTRDR